MRIRLRDGRHVGVEEHGTGVPLIWLPGTPGSRVWKAPFVPAGIRLVIIERPGFGESDPLPGRRYLEWPDDLAQVVDQLGIGDFALAGTSGAGAYLHVCGVKLAYRVRKLGVIACMGPADIADGMPFWRRAALALARVAPQKLVKATLPRDPEALYRVLTRDAPPSRPVPAHAVGLHDCARVQTSAWTARPTGGIYDHEVGGTYERSVLRP